VTTIKMYQPLFSNRFTTQFDYAWQWAHLYGTYYVQVISERTYRLSPSYKSDAIPYRTKNAMMLPRNCSNMIVMVSLSSRIGL
jgi:hypothetical protein